jgi:hypothetical protein
VNLLFPVMLGCLLYSGGIGAQPVLAKQNLTLAQGERRSVELKQGMTLQEVQDLLGKPKRTALKALSHGSTPELWQSVLHWTYAWPGTPVSDRNLEVVFASSKAPAGWLVQSWDWSGY